MTLTEKKSALEKLKGRAIKHILNEAYSILGHPILLYDTSYNLFGHTEGIVTDDWPWNELTTLGTFSHESVDFFNKENFILSFAESEVVSMMKSDKLKYDRMTGKLFDEDNVQLGDITVIACIHPFEDGDCELIELLCEILSVELQNSELYERIDRVYQESLFSSLIEGTAGDSRSVKTRIAEFYKVLRTNLYLAVVDTLKYEKTNTHLAYFRDLFKKLQPEYEYFIYLNNIVIIISTDNDSLSVGKDLKALNGFFETYNIYAGVSGMFNDLEDLQQYFREAINALNYGLESKSLRNIFRYDDFRLIHLIHSICAGGAELHSAVSAIRKRDAERGESLMDTLYYYLLYVRDSDMTCRALGISSGELSERLRIMENLFEIDFNDGNMLANMFISIKLLISELGQ